MRRFVALAAAVALTGITASGQVAGMHRGIYIGVGNYQATNMIASAKGELQPNGTFVTYPTGSNANPQGWGNMWHAADDPNNRGVITYQLTGQLPNTTFDFTLFDTVLPGTTQTFWSRPFSTITIGFPQNVTDVTLNSDGYVVGIDNNNAPTADQVVRLDLKNGTWAGTTLTFPTNVVNPGLGGFAYDRLAGNYYFANSRGSAQLFSLNSTFAGLTTVATTTSTMIVADLGGDLLEDGTWISSSFNGNLYDFVAAGANTWTAGPASTNFTTDVSRERYSAPGSGYYACFLNPFGASYMHQIAYMDATTTPHTVTTLNAMAVLPNVSNTTFIMEAHALYNNDLCTVRTGKATWDINIRPDPVLSQYAGRNFVVVASLTTPNRANPIALPSGRELFLAPDPLTNLIVKGLSAPFVQNTIGTLDPFGNATGKIDLSLLAPNRLAVNGTVVHFAGIVLNPAAPDGVDWVLEPWAFVVNILP